MILTARVQRIGPVEAGGGGATPSTGPDRLMLAFYDGLASAAAARDVLMSVMDRGRGRLVVAAHYVNGASTLVIIN